MRSTFSIQKIDGCGTGGQIYLQGASADRVVQQAMSLLGGSVSLMGGTVWLVAVCGVSLNQLEAVALWNRRRVDRKAAIGYLQAGLDLLSLAFHGDGRAARRCWRSES